MYRSGNPARGPVNYDAYDEISYRIDHYGRSDSERNWTGIVSSIALEFLSLTTVTSTLCLVFTAIASTRM